MTDMMELTSMGDRIDWLASMLFTSRQMACYTFAVGSYSTLQRWISGEREPRMVSLKAMLGFGVSLNWVVGGVGPVVVIELEEGEDLHKLLTDVIREHQPAVVPPEYRHLVKRPGTRKGKGKGKDV